MKIGNYGLGGIGVREPSDYRSVIIGPGSNNDWTPNICGGWQANYNSDRIFQMVVTTSVPSAAYFRYVPNQNPMTTSEERPWARIQNAGTSDINLKNIDGELDVNQSLSNIEKMEFKKFYYLTDEDKKPRRGIIAQQIMDIDPQYVHNGDGAGQMTIDSNPLLMDALAAIQALSAKIKYFESRLNLRADVASEDERQSTN